MARVATLRDRVAGIIRKYKHVSPHKFFYNDKSDLRERYTKIKVWYLIHDPLRGYSVLNMDFRRKEPMTVSEWGRMHKERVGKYDSLYNVFTQAVLPAINNKGGNAWRFISLLGWTGLRDIYRPEDTAASKGRNKTAKKRTTAKRGSNRRRHRN